MCSVPSPKKKKLIFFSPTSRPPKRSLRKQGNRRVRKKKNFVPPYPGSRTSDLSTEWGLYLTLGPTSVRYGYGSPYPTLPYAPLPPLREEPYAGGRADLPWKPYLRQLLDEDNHCTSGGAPPELWYWVSSSLCETSSLCRVIQVQIDLLFGLNLHTTSEMKYF